MADELIINKNTLTEQQIEDGNTAKRRIKLQNLLMDKTITVTNGRGEPQSLKKIVDLGGKVANYLTDRVKKEAVFACMLAVAATMGFSAPEAKAFGLNAETVGNVLGAAGGAVAGSQFGQGKGQLAATAVGTLVGAAVGGEVGKSVDQTSGGYSQQGWHPQPRPTYIQPQPTYVQPQYRPQYQQQYQPQYQQQPQVVYQQQQPQVIYVQPQAQEAPVIYQQAPQPQPSYTAPSYSPTNDLDNIKQIQNPQNDQERASNTLNAVRASFDSRLDPEFAAKLQGAAIASAKMSDAQWTKSGIHKVSNLLQQALESPHIPEHSKNWIATVSNKYENEISMNDTAQRSGKGKSR